MHSFHLNLNLSNEHNIKLRNPSKLILPLHKISSAIWYQNYIQSHLPQPTPIIYANHEEFHNSWKVNDCFCLGAVKKLKTRNNSKSFCAALLGDSRDWHFSAAFVRLQTFALFFPSISLSLSPSRIPKFNFKQVSQPETLAATAGQSLEHI